MAADPLDPQPPPTAGHGDVWRDAEQGLRWLVTLTAVIFFLAGLSTGGLIAAMLAAADRDVLEIERTGGVR